MSAETTARIFDPYYSTKFAGRGLGLSVVHGVVRAHGGAIAVESAPERGTTVRMAFPTIQEIPAQSIAPPDLAWRGRGTVLLVDDEEIVRSAVGRMLRKLGLSVVLAASGQEALDALTLTPYQLVLMDCHMPEMDGWTATAAIRAREGALRHTPIIALTANALASERERCLASGMDDYLAKPVPRALLAETLARWLPGPLAGDELPPGSAAEAAPVREALKP